jgi:two-component system, chemotaxis family, sensor kinase Cph1
MSYEPVDLTNCDREPIHIPGLIQPHGILLVLKPPALEIVQVSQNLQAITGHQPQQVLGQPLSRLFNEAQVDQIRQCLAANFEVTNPLDFSLQLADQTLYFDGIVHSIAAGVVLELEPRDAPQTADFFDFYRQVRGIITRLQQAPTQLEMCQVAVKEVRRLTGFDRVMVYQFDPEEAGSVIAEATDQPVPYLGLRYPQSDIPRQARELYRLSWLRLIPDVSYQPVPLIPTENPLSQEPLDLSLSVLRSVSPLHLEYLQNMGVTASMSVSLIQDQALWGLIACHHTAPKYISYALRTICEFIGQVMSVELANKKSTEDGDYKIQLKSLQTQCVEALSQADSFLAGMVQLEPQLLMLANASGAVICSGGHCVQVGQTPSEAEVHTLLEWIKPHFEQGVFTTASLAQSCPNYSAAEALQPIASGVLALEISRVQHHYILWFRPEVVQTVYWGGNPNKPVEVQADQSLRLTPRKSFERWQEIVQGRSLPWKPAEIEVVSELRSLIVGIILQQADEMAAMNFELQRSNEELDSFAYIASHDLKEPLRGIHNYANFLMEDYVDILDTDGVAKLQTLVRLTQRMEDLINSLLYFSQLGRAELLEQAVNLNELVQQVTTTLAISRPQSDVVFRLARSLPTINCDYAQVSELFTNLVSNAIKYNNKPEKWVEIGYLDPSSERLDSADGAPPAGSRPYSATNPILYVRDNGIGISPEHVEKIFQIFRRLHGRDDFGGGTGVGLTIARKIVERHGGRIWLESIPSQGSTFYFTLAAEETL